jgi:hypothetical protein
LLDWYEVLGIFELPFCGAIVGAAITAEMLDTYGVELFVLKLLGGFVTVLLALCSD